MARKITAEQLATWTFLITMGGLVLYVGAVFFFVLLR